ncbi:DUF1624 domain-containing protein [Microbacterium oxydans]|nr:DUF1624 domain-containing protein [Microbacterium oxydans]
MPQDTNTHTIARPHRTARREQPTPPPESDAARRRGELGRMVGIDFARFLAIIGMFCAHLLPPAGLPGHVEGVSTIVDGNASTLFAVVGGISVVLATRSYLERGHVAAARWAMAVRGVLVILIGATLALAPGSIVVVLVYFGVAMLCSIPFLRVSPRWLLVSAAILAIAGPILNAFLRQALGVIGEGGGVSWPQWGEPAVALRAIFVTGTYPVVTWIVYVLVGMAVATLLIAARRNGTEKRFLAWTAGIGAFLAVFAVSTSALVYEFFGRAVLVATPAARGGCRHREHHRHAGLRRSTLSAVVGARAADAAHGDDPRHPARGRHRTLRHREHAVPRRSPPQVRASRARARQGGGGPLRSRSTRCTCSPRRPPRSCCSPVRSTRRRISRGGTWGRRSSVSTSLARSSSARSWRR